MCLPCTAIHGFPSRNRSHIDEAAALLGVSVKTFNKALHTENLPARKIGREWKFSRQALIDWVGCGQSNEFYKESTDSGELKPKAPAVGNGQRTSGWRLELD